MITHVKHLTEALARFNPDARLEFQLDVQGPSPETQCNIRISDDDSMAAKLSEAETKIKDLEEEIEKLLE